MSADAGAAAVPVPVDAGTRPSSGRPELGAAGRGEGTKGTNLTNLTNSRVAVKGMASSCGTRCVRRSRSRARGKWGHGVYGCARAPHERRPGRTSRSCRSWGARAVRAASALFELHVLRLRDRRRPETRETPVGSAHSCRAAAASCAFRSERPSGRNARERARRLIHHNKTLKRRGGI